MSFFRKSFWTIFFTCRIHYVCITETQARIKHLHKYFIDADGFTLFVTTTDRKNRLCWSGRCCRCLFSQHNAMVTFNNIPFFSVEAHLFLKLLCVFFFTANMFTHERATISTVTCSACMCCWMECLGKAIQMYHTKNCHEIENGLCDCTEFVILGAYENKFLPRIFSLHKSEWASFKNGRQGKSVDCLLNTEY